MDRRDFLKKSALAGAGFIASQSMQGKIVKDGMPMNKNHADLGSNAANGILRQAFEERKLGKRKVTSIGLGTVDICPVGYYGCSTTKEDMLRLVRRAYDHGITLFDTAEVYGSEEWVGEASAKTIRRAHAVQPLSAVESEYAIWWREPETKIFPTLEELGIDFVAYAPIGRGYLTGIHNENSRYVLPDRRAVLPRFEPEAMKHNMPLIRLVQRWAELKGITPAQFAIAWVLSMRPYTLAIPGTTKYWHLDELVGNPMARLSADELTQFNSELEKIDIMGHRANAAIESQIDK